MQVIGDRAGRENGKQRGEGKTRDGALKVLKSFLGWTVYFSVLLAMQASDVLRIVTR